MEYWKPTFEDRHIGTFSGSLPTNVFETVNSPLSSFDSQQRCSNCISNRYHFVVHCNKCFGTNCCQCIFKNNNKCSVCQQVQENMKIERSKEAYSKKLGHQCLLETNENLGRYQERSEKTIHLVTEGGRNARKIWSQNIIQNLDVLSFCYEKLVAACDEKIADIVFEHFGNTNDLTNLARANLEFVVPNSRHSHDVENFVNYNNRLWVKSKAKKKHMMAKMIFAFAAILIILFLAIIGFSIGDHMFI